MLRAWWCSGSRGDESLQQAAVLSRARWCHAGVRWCPPSRPEAGGSRVAPGEQRSGAGQGSSLPGQHLGPILAPSPPAPSSLAGPGLTAVPSAPLHPHLRYLQAPSKHPRTQAESRFPPRGQGDAGWDRRRGLSAAPLLIPRLPLGIQASPRDQGVSPGTTPPCCFQGSALAGCPRDCLDRVPLAPGAGSCPLAGWQCHRGGGRGRMAASAVPCPLKDSQA